MIDPNLRLLEEAATVLRPVLDEFVFVGGGLVAPGARSDIAELRRELGATE